VLVVDLQSLSREEERNAIVNRVLDAVWKKGKQEQWEALRDFDKPDLRRPTFIVIDEAHNLIPERKTSPASESLTAKVVRIAAEGRKYGLYLIVVTQRPRKVDSNILAECDNLLLMKVTNQSDLDFAEQAFGFLSKEITQRATALTTGELLLTGSLGRGPTIFHVSPRRTLEGGRSIDDSYWGVP
jgi:DNA helicase HerA-like ATPase